MEYTTIKNVFYERKTEPYAASFEYTQVEVSVVKDADDKYYMRVCRKCCTAEGNGRPVTTVENYCYPVDKEAVINETNWKSYESFINRIQLECGSYEGIS